MVEVVQRPLQQQDNHNLQVGQAVHINSEGDWVPGVRADRPIGIVSVVPDPFQFRVGMKGSSMELTNHGFPLGSDVFAHPSNAGELTINGPPADRLAVVKDVDTIVLV